MQANHFANFFSLLHYATFIREIEYIEQNYRSSVSKNSGIILKFIEASET